MERDDIIRMAKEAGFKPGFLGHIYVGSSTEAVERFAYLVAEAERDRCCAIVFGQCDSDNVAQRTVDAIRASGSSVNSPQD